MAVYRQIQIKFWQDCFVSDIPLAEKSFYLYLMTNSMTTQCGIYNFNRKQAACDLDLNRETVDTFLKKFVQYGKILVSEDTNEIMLLNWMKHNYINSRNTLTCINKELKEIKSKAFLKRFYLLCKDSGYSLDIIFNGIVIPSIEEDKDSSPEEAMTREEQAASGTSEGVCKPFLRVLEGAYKDLGEEKTKTEIQKEEEALAAAASAFSENLHPITPIEKRRLKHWLKEVEPEVVMLAIEEAVNNNGRSMNYINKVLSAWQEQGITTEAAALEHLKNRSSRNVKNNKGSSGSFEEAPSRANAAAYKVIGG